MREGLLIVDVQNDFCPGGALAVAGGDAVVPVFNQYIAIFLKKQVPVFASRDRHPRKAVHFKTYAGKWPERCIQKTQGENKGCQ